MNNWYLITQELYLLVEWLQTTKKNDYLSVREWQCERIQSIFSLRIKYIWYTDTSLKIDLDNDNAHLTLG